MFSSRWMYDFGVREGSSVAFQAALTNIPEVAEEGLSWKQILDFRSDPEARRKYRDLKMWLASAIKAQSVAEAEDIIAKKLQDYEWAINKHGLRTVTGGLTSVLSSETVVSIAAGSGITALFSRPIWALAAGAAIASAKIGLWIAERKIDLRDIKRGSNSEVALIHDAKQLVSGGTDGNRAA